jgi:hypothetical protein
MKTYENFISDSPYKYNLGDYIVTTYNLKKIHSETIVGSRLCGKIIHIDPEDSNVPYLIQLLAGDMWVRENMITRKMTEEEIEEFEFLSSTIKYNL